MSYANMDGVPTQTAGTSEILASDWNTYVRDNFDSIKFGHIVCESTSRPTGIAEGTMIYETDTQKVLVYNGSSWVEVSDLDSADGLSVSAQTKLDNNSLIYVATTSFSGVSSVSFEDKFTSTYTNYLLKYSVTASASTPSIRGRFLYNTNTQRNDSNYYSMGYKYNYTGTASNLLISPGDNFFVGEVGASGGECSMWIYNPETSARKSAYWSVFFNHNSVALEAGWVGGQYNQNTQQTGIYLYPTSGNITGEAWLYGVKE